MVSPFVAAAVCEALCAAADRGAPGARAGVQELGRYLRAVREADGSWCFEPVGRPCPPDADTTSCALAALARAGEAGREPILSRIVDVQPSEDGLIRPWLLWYAGAGERLDGNIADAIVTSNVLLAGARLGADVSSVQAALEDHVRVRGLRGVATVYYDSLAVRTYYLARALSPVAIDGPTAQALRRFLSDLGSDDLNIVEVAAAVAAGALLGAAAPVGDLVPHLLASQERDGSWPAARWFGDIRGTAWRSAAFSTALAVEALTLVEGRTLT